ncbi:S-layer homology domain-containing protein [Bacillus sp. Marseille-Q3570]|uniref:S-layer homology domain-containing protein n=1 Tax=Bacillus sp. Marseille-Q3570 TaxID=2963522 RepID=UPI0021B70A64|nr:S-layer homology domain-containing protein [Bacillus sp. Marseille-Q3570]
MKRLFSIFMALALILSFQNSNVSAAETFTDLGGVSWAEDEIYYLNDRGIINGYGNGKFGPSDQITREQAALMLVREFYPLDTTIEDPGYSDVSKDSFYYEAIAVATEHGLFNGFPDNTFKPKDKINRAATAKIIALAFDLSGSKASTFTDLDQAKWAKEYILALDANNIVNGYADSTFKPLNNITRAEFSVAFARALDDRFKPMDDLSVHFIDVGQGDSTLMVSPSGKTILVDGGRKSAGQKVVDYLAQAGINTVDLLVATHPDADHIGGLIDVLEQVNVERVLDSGKAHTSETYLEYLDLINQKNIPFEEAVEGSTLTFDDVLDIQVLNGLNTSGDNNESSIVLKVSHGDIDFLLTGDASVDNEFNMVNNYDVEAEILKVGHHGSSTSTSDAFISEVNPEIGILSYGENSYGHPYPDVVHRLWDAGAELYSTCQSGTITVTTNGVSYGVDASPYNGEDNCSSITDPEPDPEPEPEPQYPINVNTADFETLQLIKGVGPTIAQNIIDYRNTNGPFQTIDELDNVKYIGPATIEEMRPYITL